MKIPPMPVVLVGKDFWKDMVSWVEKTLLGGEKYISPGDMDLFRVADSAEEAAAIVREWLPKTRQAAETRISGRYIPKK